MSLLEQLGARLRATADELPLDLVAVAAGRLQVAADLLMWVRQESANPMGVPELANATEHLEHAGHALRVGQDAVGEYLAAIGLGYDSAAPKDAVLRGALADSEAARPGSAGPPRPDAEPVSALRRWWTRRVDELADRADTGEPADRDAAAPERQRRDAATDSAELLRRVAGQVRAGDRDRLHRELRQVAAPVGLGLATLSPPVLRHLATELLGHEPAPADLDRLAGQTAGAVRALMPRLPDAVVATVLARVCRVPAPRTDAESPQGQQRSTPAHPTDPAVAGALLTGVLLQRLGRDPDTLRAAADAGPGQRRGTGSGDHA